MPFIYLPIPEWSIVIIVPCIVSVCGCCVVRCIEEEEEKERKEIINEDQVYNWGSPNIIEMIR